MVMSYSAAIITVTMIIPWLLLHVHIILAGKGKKKKKTHTEGIEFEAFCGKLKEKGLAGMKLSMRHGNGSNLKKMHERSRL